MLKCKHFGKFGILVPIESDGNENMIELKKTKNLKSFMKKNMILDELSYFDLSPEQQKTADEMQDKMIAEQGYDAFEPCKKYCLNGRNKN